MVKRVASTCSSTASAISLWCFFAFTQDPLRSYPLPFPCFPTPFFGLVVWWFWGGFPFAFYKNQGFKSKSKPPIQTTNPNHQLRATRNNSQKAPTRNIASRFFRLFASVHSSGENNNCGTLLLLCALPHTGFGTCFPVKPPPTSSDRKTEGKQGKPLKNNKSSPGLAGLVVAEAAAALP